jgi:hypothetical protein
MPMDKHKLTVKLPQDTMTLMMEMADNSGVTKTEVLRQTVALQHRLRKELQGGKQILIHDPITGQNKELIIL